MNPFERPLAKSLRSALMAPDPFVHILIGPRQVGKSTLAKGIADSWKGPVVMASADGPLPPAHAWIEAQWRRAEAVHSRAKPALLVIDEIQKVKGWSESVKALWDASKSSAPGLRVLLLGSSA